MQYRVNSSQCHSSTLCLIDSQPQLLLCRFLMNLRQLNHHSQESEGSPPSNYSSVRFQIETRVIGNMGESLRDDAYETEEIMGESEAETALRSEHVIEETHCDSSPAAASP